MTTPEKPLKGRYSALPVPKLVSLPDDPVGACAVIEAPWWTYYGGKLDANGRVRLPEIPAPACPLSNCDTCRGEAG